jgi:branched-chain amino acid transport system permease protein
LFLQDSFAGFFGPDPEGYPRPEALEGRVTILGLSLDRMDVLVVAVTVVAVVVLQLFIKRTKTGKAMRAVAEDREIASLMGIDVDRAVVTTFAAGGMLAGVAGVLYAMTFGNVSPFMGFLPGIAAFTAAVLGGIGSVAGAALGGLLLGVSTAVAPYLLLSGFHVPAPNQLRDVVTFSILVLVLIFRPGGILGSGAAEKV